MAVYIDNFNAPFGRMLMSHMATDGDIEELHQMADKIGVARKWFQDKGNHPHYDICKSKKELAIQYGAINVEARELIKLCYKPLIIQLNKPKCDKCESIEQIRLRIQRNNQFLTSQTHDFKTTRLIKQQNDTLMRIVERLKQHKH